jgi:WhiB family redox-sensing transcriptional regulator
MQTETTDTEPDMTTGMTFMTAASDAATATVMNEHTITSTTSSTTSSAMHTTSRLPQEPEMKGMGTDMLAPLSNEEFSPDWWDEALCRDGEGSLTSVYFSEELQDIARAKTICSECPVMLTCLEGAIARHEPWGVWGGQMFLNGKILATKRRRGRPPKTPRPEDQLPEIPVPVHLQGYLRSA